MRGGEKKGKYRGVEEGRGERSEGCRVVESGVIFLTIQEPCSKVKTQRSFKHDTKVRNSLQYVVTASLPTETHEWP